MKSLFSTRGVTLKLLEGDVVLIPGDNIQMQPQGNTVTITALTSPNVFTTGIPWQPPALSNGTAPNNSLYYSTNSAKLTFKDPQGSTHSLY